MGGLEQFKPQLKTGRISPLGQSIIYEVDNPADQIILPIEILDFLTQCNGQLSVTEIIENIYRKKNTIQFKLIYQTLLTLREKNFLENGAQLDHLNGSHFEKESSQYLSFTPFWSFSIGRRIVSDAPQPVLFYLSALLVCVGAILSLQNFDISWLHFRSLQVKGSYATGFFFAFLCASFMLSMKNFIKSVLLLFLTGRIHKLSLTVNGFAAYLRVSSDSLFLVQNRFFVSLFHSANILSVFAVLYIASWLNLPRLETMYSVATFLFFFDLNPYQPSEISSLLKSLVKNDTLNRMSNYLEYKSLLALVTPYDRRKNETLFRAFACYALVWSAVALLLLSWSLGDHMLNLLAAIRTAGDVGKAKEWASGLLVLSVLVSFKLIIGYNAYKLLKLHFNFWAKAHRFISEYTQKKIRITKKDKDVIIQVLQEFSLFSHFNVELLDQIVQESQLRELSPSSVILSPGETCESLHILITGQARVDNKTVQAPAIFGEASFLESPVQMQKITAQKSGYILILPPNLSARLQATGLHEREIESFKNSILVMQYFANAPVFRDLSEEITRLFITKGKIENFKKDQIIFKQSDLADGFYLLLKGSVEVIVHRRPVTKIHEGGFFGEVSMIADIPRTATLYATQDCKTLRITREAFWEILAKDINMAMFIESVGEMRIQEDVEMLRIA